MGVSRFDMVMVLQVAMMKRRVKAVGMQWERFHLAMKFTIRMIASVSFFYVSVAKTAIVFHAPFRDWKNPSILCIENSVILF